MKVCIIGTGNQGSGIAGLLAAENDVEEIILADRTLEIAEKAKTHILALGDRCITKSIRTAAVDAKNYKEVAKIANGSDVIVNGILPCFNIPIMKACLEVKANYLDLYSLPVQEKGIPYEETIDAQFDLNADFHKNGITAIPAVGICPGFSTMVAIHLIDQFSQVDKVLMRVIDYTKTEEFVSPVYPSVLFKHWMGPPHPIYYENGQVQAIDLLDSEEEFEFPEPIGKRVIYCDSATADLVLLPRYAGKEIGCIYAKGAVTIGEMPLKDVWLKALSQHLSQHYEKENVDLFEKLGSYLKTEDDIPGVPGEKKVFSGGAFSFVVEVVGMKGAEKCIHRITLVTDFDVATKHLPWSSHGVYATIGTAPIELVLMMGRGEIGKKGVISVAELDKVEIIKRVSKRGHRIWENIEKQY